MTITVYSVMTAILWCSLFIILICVLLRWERFIMYFDIYPVLFLILMFFVRLLCVFELPFVRIIRSYMVLSNFFRFLQIMPFSFLSDKLTFTVSDIFLAVWIAGIFLYLWKNLRQYIRFRRSTEQFSHIPDEPVASAMQKITGSMKSRKNVTILQSPLIDAPCITGFFRPVIYLPEIVLTDVEQNYILRHEWNHYLHKDMWIKLLFELICAVFWWNPLSYFLKKNLDHSLEIRNDLLMTRHMSDSGKKEYLGTILKIAAQIQSGKQNHPVPSPYLGLVIHTRGRMTKERFRYVLHRKEKTKIQKAASVFAYLLIGMIFIFSFTFVLQPAGDAPESYPGEFIEINAENAYLILENDGTYSMYVDGECIEHLIDDITMLPYSELEIRE